jgi:hypothetical protein
MTASIDLLCVNPADVQKVWPLARDLIRAAIERTDLSDFADIEKDVLAGDQLLWLAISDRVEAAATTHLSRNVCTVTACSGHQRERWLSLRASIEKYAKNEGCHTIRAYGRKGWERVLANDGYRVEHVIIEKAL